MKVRLHAYSGLKQIFQTAGTQYATDSVKMMKEPYLWGETKDSNGATPVAFTTNNTQGVTCIRVEVQDSQAIRYEINPTPGNPASVRVPGANSPKLTGIDVFDFHPGWEFSFVDAASV